MYHRETNSKSAKPYRSLCAWVGDTTELLIKCNGKNEVGVMFNFKSKPHV